MKCLKTIIPFLLLSINLYAQYDGGTVIYNQTSSTNLTSILKNYIVEDFDGDFNADIIMVMHNAVTNTNHLTWYKGNGSGNFSAQTNILNVNDGHKENEIFYEDMNGDGNKDIVFQNSDAGFTILLNDGQGSIVTQLNNNIIVPDLYDSELCEIADIDSDGDMDALFTGTTWSTSPNIYRENCLLAYNTGNGNFSNYNYLNDDDTKVITLIEATDIDGDNDLDIIYSGNENMQSAGGFGPTFYVDSYVRLYENLGTNEFAFKTELTMPEVTAAEPAFTHIKVHDINNDGNDELLIEYAIWDICQDPIHMHGCTFHYQFQVLNYNAQNSVFELLENYNSWLHGYKMNELLFSAEEFYDEAFLIQFGHQNADNNLDILSINVPQGKLHWYNGNGNGGFNNGQTVNFNSQYSNTRPALRAGDIDNDTDLDVFVLLNDNTSSTLTIYKNLVLSPSCASLLDLGNTFLANGIYQAGTTLISSGNVAPGNNNVVLKAGENIKLQSGFEAPANSTVKVRISSCN